MSRPLRAALVSDRTSRAHARLSAEAILRVEPTTELRVLDLDGSYVPIGTERTVTPAEVGLEERALHLRAARGAASRLLSDLLPLVAETFEPRSDAVLCLLPGVVVLQQPDNLTGPGDAARRLVRRTPGPLLADGLHPDQADIDAAGEFATCLLGIRPGGGAGDVEEPSTLVSWWSLDRGSQVSASADGGLLLDGRQVDAVDLSGLDPARPWLLDARESSDPRARLSDHPALASFVAAAAARLTADQLPEPTGGWDPTRSSLDTPVDDVLRALYADPPSDAPDPFADAERDALLAWLTAPAPDGAPGRYLSAVRRLRPDLLEAFPRVPGPDTTNFLAWARANAVAEGYPAQLVGTPVASPSRPPARPRRPRGPRRGRPSAGLNVVGFLRGELGIGESARLVVAAARAAHVPVHTVSVDEHALGPTRDAVASTDTGGPFDATVLCVNADLTPVVAPAVGQLLDRSYRIGMWYWEVEEFPATLHGAFAFVDEVWVATDFVRAAVEPHSPVPVRTLMPPLPQRGDEPTLTRADLGLPDGFLFLFVFDHLSTLDRKNPLGLIDAFTSAFGPRDGAVLVLKSLNAHRRPSDAERLRLHAAGHPHVHLREEYLQAAERDALVAHSDAYVSLHRSEGLGLTMAEAMAWGKPVVATGYSGNLQFMNDDNSFLVPWAAATIPGSAAPYPTGGRWAEPDLDAAARLMRRLVDDPAAAAAVGERAARDIRELHSVVAAGGPLGARLSQIRRERRRRSSGWPRLRWSLRGRRNR
ncbi:glycosyltransferase [Cellulomonas sp. McL0617]|uniref:glycosyltransferase n=1 Tax=Cellulomonas sp. McL0617 TaxID=3415675 RepID=UPI003CF06773